MRKSISGHTFLKDAGALLTATILISTALFVFIPMTKITKAESILCSENFDEAWGPYGNNPPVFWTIFTNEPMPVTWDFNNWHRYLNTGTDYCARIYYSPVQPQDDWLISPFIDCRGFSNIQLTFNDKYYYYSIASHAKIWGRIGSGGTWSLIQSYTSSHTSWTPETYPLAWADGQNNVQIAFEYIDYDGLYWYIDNFQVTGVVANTPPTAPQVSYPTNGATGLDACSPLTLTWIPSTDTDPITYDVYFDFGSGYQHLGSTTANSYPLTSYQLFSGTTYSWYVTASDGINPAVAGAGSPWSFTTAPSVLQITDISGSSSQLKVVVKNTGSNDITGIALEIKITIDTTKTPCGCGCVSFLKIGGTLFYNSYTDSSTFELAPVGTTIHRAGGVTITDTFTRTINIQKGCACFKVTVTLDACGASPSSGYLQVIKQGCFSDLNIW
jgi:hypothetical protein